VWKAENVNEQTLAARFADAVAQKDRGALMALLHPEIDFEGMTPKRTWGASTPGDVADVFAAWFDEDDVIERIDWITTDAFSDRERAGYRFQVRNGGGLHLVEQQAYLSDRDGQIGWLRVLCAGFRPIDP
jgi:hypothetical protein